eukprot:COSAG02_NODE_62122_length_266_cov_1.874251_1_plen_54_part_01
MGRILVPLGTFTHAGTAGTVRTKRRMLAPACDNERSNALPAAVVLQSCWPQAVP